jgi:hypothetical protein
MGISSAAPVAAQNQCNVADAMGYLLTYTHVLRQDSTPYVW